MNNRGITKRNVLKVSSLFIVATIIAALSLTACVKQSGKPAPAPVPSNPQYIETAVNFPEGVQKVDSLEKTDSGKVWMVENTYRTDEPSTLLWELNDDNSWKEVVNIRELLSLDKKDSVFLSAITKNNKVICFVFHQEDYASDVRLYLIDLELESGYRELNIDTSVFIRNTDSGASFTPIIAGVDSLKNDRFFIYNQTSSYVLDIPNETIKHISYEEGNAFRDFYGAAELGGNLYVLYEEMEKGYSEEQGTLDVSKMLPWFRGTGNPYSLVKLSILDESTGALSTLDNEELTNLLVDNGDVGTYRVIPTIEADYDSTERITICLRGGIIEYSNGEARKIVDAEGTILSDTSKDVQGHAFFNQDDFFLFSYSLYNAEAPSNYSLYKYEKIAGV